MRHFENAVCAGRTTGITLIIKKKQTGNISVISLTYLIIRLRAYLLHRNVNNQKETKTNYALIRLACAI